MRIAMIAGLVLIGCAGCTGSEQRQSDAEWAARVLPGASDPAATIRVAAAESGHDCSLFWNGEAITAEELGERSRETMQTAVVVAGGIDRMTADQIPYLKLEVAPDLRFDCVAPVLETIRGDGYSRVGLKPDLTGPTPHFVHFPLTQAGAASPTVTVAVSPGGTITWNGEQVDLAALGARAQPLATAGSSAGNRGALVIIPAREASFAAIYEAIRVIRENGMEPDWASS